MPNSTEVEKIKIFSFKDYIVVTKEEESTFFSSYANYFSISIANLAFLLKFLLFRNFMSPKVLEGILSEFYEAEKWK